MISAAVARGDTMARLEDLKKDAVVQGILSDGAVAVIDASWFGSTVEVTYKDQSGKVGQQLLFPDGQG